jgi:hypothetical protein
MLLQPGSTAVSSLHCQIPRLPARLHITMEHWVTKYQVKHNNDKIMGSTCFYKTPPFITLFTKVWRWSSWIRPHHHSFFSVVQKPNWGLCCLIIQISRSHTIRHIQRHPVELLCTSDQPVAEAATYTTHNQHKRRTSMPLAKFEPAISATKRPQTYALDRTATGIGAPKLS